MARATRLKPIQKGPNGRNCCRYCGNEVRGRRITFCSDECVHEWSVRSNPGYARSHVRKRDNEICALCGRDCRSPDAPCDGRGHTWEADHIVPVVEGGGECGLDNLRTLCILCHKHETAQLAAKRAGKLNTQTPDLWTTTHDA